ncbi:MAG: CehA/McbA family metallohydrolase [bacterium]|nr:CehA/McbA family metallohydrolase [Candidatus Sumerlaeota bacterium]
MNLSRRDMLRALGFLTFESGMNGLISTLRAAGDAPWWEIPPAVLAGEDHRLQLDPMLKISGGSASKYPCVAVLPKGKTWVCWSSLVNNAEQIRLAPCEEGKILNDNILAVDRRGHAFQPNLIAMHDKFFAAWSCFVKPGVWTIQGAVIDTPGVNVVDISNSPGAICLRPALAQDEHEGIWIVWEELEPGKQFVIKARMWQNGTPGPIITVSGRPDRDNRRPAITTDQSGGIIIAWDRYDEQGSTNIVFKRISHGGKFAGDEKQISQGRAFNMAPALAPGPDGMIWLAWHTNRWDNNIADIPRWFELRAMKHEQLLKPKTPSPGRVRESDSTVQGFEFARLLSMPDGTLWLSGRASQNFYLQSFSPNGWSPLYRLPKDGWGGRGQYLQMAAAAESRSIWTARRDLDQAIAQEIGAVAPVKPHSRQWPLIPDEANNGAPAALSLAISSSNSATPARHIVFEPWRGMKYYFGDLHGHTSLSDGTGEIDEYYLMRRDEYAMDFASLTDHDTFVGSSLHPSEWEQIKEITEHFNEPGRFATLFGYEWTTLRTPKGSGHMCVYSTKRDMPLMDHTDPEFENAAKLTARAKQLGCICIPHHIGWTGVVWEQFDPAVVPVAEIVSVHGAYEFMGNRPIAHRGGIKGCFIQDGLARGLRFGLIGGTDCHGLLWQHGVCWKRDPFAAGLACVLAPELSRESVFDAIRNRRCYATSGVRMRMVFEINGRVMGETFESADPHSILIEFDSESPVQWIELVRNNATLHSFGAEGHRSTFRWEDKNPPPGTSVYFARITCRDGNMAWSSPIWVTRPS